jgi:hypothetical protein
MLSNRRSAFVVAFLTFSIAGNLSPSFAAEKIALREVPSSSRVYRVDHHLTVTGELKTAVGEGKARELELKVDADHRYRERRLPASGRGPAALRALRHHDLAAAKISVAGQTSSSRLRDSRQRIVAEGHRDGVASHSPDGPLTAGEVDLLEVPGDSLAMLALLPVKLVEPGDTWEPESWAAQMLTSMEAVLKSEMTCKLEKVTGDIAYVSFEGKIEGATDGSAANVNLAGTFEFDVKQNYIRQFEVNQREKRSVGAVSPGMNVQAKATLKRSIEATPGPLTDAVVENVPLETDAKSMKLSLDTAWRTRLTYGRSWRLFHQSGDTVVLRLLEAGSLISQCNMSRITSAAAGKHTSEMQFQKDIQRALGDRLKTIAKAEELEVDDGRFLYRVTAVGESNGVDMHWYYYLCAAPSGDQVTFTFAVESKLVKELDDRDIEVVQSLEFLPKNAGLPRAANRKQ